MAAAASKPATAEPSLLDFGGPILSSGPVGRATLAPPPVISFNPGVPAVAGTVTPVSSGPTLGMSAAPSAAPSPAAATEAPRAVVEPTAPAPPTQSTPPILSDLPTELALPELPELPEVPILAAVSDLVGVDLSVPLVAGSDAVPLIVQPAVTSAANLPGISLGL